MKARGFTVVEILVVIIIMAILLTLAVVNVRSTQINARDAERQTDVENIAIRLESYYNAPKGATGGGSHYPATADITPDALQTMLPEFNTTNFRAPGNNDEGTINLVPATNIDETAEGVRPQPTYTSYVYQPIDEGGQKLCTTAMYNCRRFNIFYRLEIDGSIQVIKSKHR